MRQVDKAYVTETARKVREKIAKRVAKERSETLKVVRECGDRVLKRLADDLWIVTTKTIGNVKVKLEEKEDVTSQEAPVPLRKVKATTKPKPPYRDFPDEDDLQGDGLGDDDWDDEDLETARRENSFLSNAKTPRTRARRVVSSSPESSTEGRNKCHKLPMNAPRILFRLMDESDQKIKRGPGRPRKDSLAVTNTCKSTTSSLMCVLHNAIKTENNANIAIIETSKLNAEIRREKQAQHESSEPQPSESNSYEEEHEFSVVGPINPAAVINVFSLHELFNCARQHSDFKQILRLEVIPISHDVTSIRNKLAARYPIKLALRYFDMLEEDIQVAIEILSDCILGIPQEKLDRDPWYQHDLHIEMNEILTREWMLGERTNGMFKLAIMASESLSDEQDDDDMDDVGDMDSSNVMDNVEEMDNADEMDIEEDEFVEEYNHPVEDGGKDHVEMDIDDDWW